MGRLVYLMNVSLDGFVADGDGSLDWSDPDDELHSWFNDQTKSVDVALYGRRLYGPDLAGQFVRRGLVELYQLVIHPVVLGSGKPFWPTLDAPLRLRLVDRLEFGSGVEMRSYVPAD